MKKIFTCLFGVIFIAIFLAYACATKTSLETVAIENPGPATLAPAGAAPQTQWERTLANGKKEGVAVIYGGYGVAESRDPFIRAMKERFGISLDVTIAQPATLTTRLANERRAGLYIADIFMGGSTSVVNELLPMKMLEPIEPHLLLPEVKNPELWFGGYLPVWDSQRTSLGSLVYVNSRIAINTRLLQPRELISYTDLLKPRLKGQIVMTDPTTSGSGLSWFSVVSKVMGVDYIKELLKQDLTLTRDFRLMNDWLAQGKYALGIGVSPGGVMALAIDGAPIAMLFPFKEGVDLGTGGGMIAVLNNNPHPNATNVFVNWVLNKEGQTIFSKGTSAASRRIDVPTDHLEPWMIPDPKFKYIIESEQDILDQYKKIELAREVFAPVLK